MQKWQRPWGENQFGIFVQRKEDQESQGSRRRRCRERGSEKRQGTDDM